MHGNVLRAREQHDHEEGESEARHGRGEVKTDVELLVVLIDTIRNATDPEATKSQAAEQESHVQGAHAHAHVHAHAQYTYKWCVTSQHANASHATPRARMSNRQSAPH